MNNDVDLWALREDYESSHSDSEDSESEWVEEHPAMSVATSVAQRLDFWQDVLLSFACCSSTCTESQSPCHSPARSLDESDEDKHTQQQKFFESMST